MGILIFHRGGKGTVKMHRERRVRRNREDDVREIRPSFYNREHGNLKNENISLDGIRWWSGSAVLVCRYLRGNSFPSTIIIKNNVPDKFGTSHPRKSTPRVQYLITRHRINDDPTGNFHYYRPLIQEHVSRQTSRKKRVPKTWKSSANIRGCNGTTDLPLYYKLESNRRFASQTAWIIYAFTRAEFARQVCIPEEFNGVSGNCVENINYRDYRRPLRYINSQTRVNASRNFSYLISRCGWFREYSQIG